MNASVTVITPTYNCAGFLGQTIRSVQSQSYPNIQHIVIDDGSNDRTADVLSGYRNLIVIRHRDNIGEHATVNEGLRLVTGKYFMIVNADDPLLMGAVWSLTRFMEDHPRVLCAYPDLGTINEDGSWHQERINRPEYDFRYMVRHHYCLPSVGAIFRSTVIHTVGLRDPKFRWTSDFDYWLRIGLQGDMCRVPERLALWRHRNGQESAARSSERAAERLRLMTKFFDQPNITPAIKAIEAEAFSWAYLVAAQITSDPTERAKYVRDALVLYPRQLVTLEFWDALRKYATWRLKR
jgi:glycosyltransferase involved in cell wall biosynthesis